MYHLYYRQLQEFQKLKPYDLQQISLAQTDIANMYKNLTADSNSSANKLYNLLDTVSVATTQIATKISTLSDMLTDLMVLNGSAANIKYLSNLPIKSSSGIEVDKDSDTIQLAKISETLQSFNNNASSISSLNPYTITDLNSNASTFSRMLKTDQEIVITFSNVGYNISLNLIFPDYTSVNTLNLKLGLGTLSFPTISNITYTDVNNEQQEAIILATKSSTMDLNNPRVVNNLYTIGLNTIITNQININLSDRTHSVLNIASLYASSNTYNSTGNIVFGPIHMNYPILKTSIDSNTISDNVSIAVSTDNISWISLANASSLNIGSTAKTVAFNTINTTSFKSSEDITTLYVKLIMTSTMLSNDTVKIYNTIREDQSVSQSLDIDSNLFSGYKIQQNYISYGNSLNIQSISSGTLDVSMIDGILENGVSICAGLIDTPISISPNSGTISNLNIKGKRLRLPSDILIDSTHFDTANSVIVDIYLKKLTEVNINTNNKRNLCLKICVPEDVYTISSTNYTMTLDLTTPYINNLLSATLIVPQDNIVIKNSIGTIIKSFAKEDLIMTVIESSIYYSISLLDVLYTAPTIVGLAPCLLYPLIALPENTWSMIDGEIVSSGSTIVNYTGYEISRTPVKVTKVVNYHNGNYINRIDQNYTYFNSQIVDTPLTNTVIKLNHVAIQPGSLTISPYINTTSSNYVPTSGSSTHYINVGTEDTPVQLVTDDIPTSYIED